MINTWIVIRARSEGTHYWIDAPIEVLFLRNEHRHEFHTTVQIEVGHDDRELEFFMVKRWLDQHLPKGSMAWQSCEMMAQRILIRLIEKYGERKYKIEVSEDGENSALVEYTP